MLGTAKDARIKSCDILLWTPTHRHASISQSARTYISSMNTGCSLKDLPSVIDDRDRWWERVREFGAVSVTWWWNIFYAFMTYQISDDALCQLSRSHPRRDSVVWKKKSQNVNNTSESYRP